MFKELFTEAKTYEKLKNELVYIDGEDTFSVFTVEPGYFEIQAIYNDGDSSYQEEVESFKDVKDCIKSVNSMGGTFPLPKKKDVEDLLNGKF